MIPLLIFTYSLIDAKLNSQVRFYFLLQLNRDLMLSKYLFNVWTQSGYLIEKCSVGLLLKRSIHEGSSKILDWNWRICI